MHAITIRLCCAALALGPAFTGCASTTDPQATQDVTSDAPPPDTQTDTAADVTAHDTTNDTAGPDTTTADVPVNRLTVRVESRGTPLAVVVVALDPANGSRVEATSGPEGVVTFDNPDLSGAGGSLIAYRWGYGVVARVGITDAADDVVLELASPTPLATAEISGVAAGMTDGDNSLLIHATIPGSTYHEAAGASWAMKVPPDEPFSLVALEYTLDDAATVSERGIAATILGVSQAWSPGVTEAATVDIDFGQSMQTTTTAGSFPIPEKGVFKDAGKGFLYVTSVESNMELFLGLPTRVDVSADGLAFDYAADTVELPGATPLTRYAVMERIWRGQLTFTTRRGYPGAGPQDITFATPTDPTVPAMGAGPHPIGDRIEWAVAPEDENMRVRLFITALDALPTVLHAPPGTQKVTFPALPTGADPAEVFGTAPTAWLTTCSLDATLAPLPLCERAAVGRKFPVTY